MNKKIYNAILFLIGIIPLIIWLVSYLNVDLWYDEVFSLENFALVTWQETYLNYPAPNNHIFYNLTSQVVSRVSGLRDIFSAADNVHVFRLFQLLITAFIAYFSFKIIKDFLFEKASFLVFVILFTSIPFMNFSLQLRGYNMSALFLVMLIFYSWTFLRDKTKFSLAMIAASTVLMLYTIPSNFYFVLAFGMINFGFWLYCLKQNKTTLKQQYFKIMLFLTLGVFVSFLLYFPVIENLLNDKHINRYPSHLFQQLFLFFEMMQAFLSARYLLAIAMIFGLYLYFKRTNEKFKLISLLLLLVVPFVMSFLHRKGAFPRVFSPLAPIFAIVSTVAIVSVFKNFTVIKRNVASIMLAVYCVFVFVNEKTKNDEVVTNQLVNHNTIKQNIYENFYLGSFFKQDSTMQFLASVNKNRLPVIRFHQLEEPSTDMYLRKYKVDNMQINQIDSLKNKIEKSDSLYILTTFRDSTLQILKAISDKKIDVVTNKNNFTNILKLY